MLIKKIKSNPLFKTIYRTTLSSFHFLFRYLYDFRNIIYRLLKSSFNFNMELFIIILFIYILSNKNIV